jgi:hypothetical protein
MATNDMGPGPLKKARRLIKKIDKRNILTAPNRAPGEKKNPFAQKGGATKKYQKGGKTTSFTKDIATGLDNVFRKTYPFNIPHTTVTKALKAVDDRITKGHEGEQPDWYNKFKDKVKKTMGVPLNKKQAGGAARGKNITQKAAERKTSKGKGYISSIMGENPSGDKGTYVPFTRAGRKDAKTKGMVSSKEMKPSRQIMKTGGMVNPNADLQAAKSAGSKGVKSGVNPKAAASKVARGRSGGTSTAPKKALPKAQYGVSVKGRNIGGNGDRTQTFKEVTITPPKKGGKVKRS